MLRRFVLTISFIAVTVFGFAAFAPSPAFAGNTAKDEVCRGVGAVSGLSGCQSDVSLAGVMRNIINVFSVIVGLIAVIMIIVAGFKYITAAGESSSITSAKQTLTYAIVGLIIAGLSQAIVKFVLERIK